MLLKDWDIWLNYSTYFIEDIPPLKNIKELLVKNGFCKNVFSSEDNHLLWKDANTIYEDVLIINKRGHERKAAIKFPNNLKGYNLECVIQSSKMLFDEKDIFNFSYLNSFHYIRCFIDPIYIYENKTLSILYPQLKIYNNGVILITFRIISSKDPISSDDFISKYLNLYRHNFDLIEIPVELLRYAYRASLLKEIINNKFKGYYFNKEVNHIDNKIEKNKKIYQNDDFKHELAQVDTIFKVDVLNIDLLQNIITSSLEYVLNKGKLLKSIFRNTKYKLNIGNFWLGFPSVYFLEYLNQPLRSNSISKKFKLPLSRLMTRVPHDSCKDWEKYLKKDLRPFDDYSVFINEALVLWIFSRKGLESDKEFYDPNRGHLIYNKQVFVESILHFYLSCRRLEERSLLKIFSYKSLIKEQLEVIEFYKNTQKVTNAGELNDFYEAAINNFNFNELKDYTDERLRIISEISKENRANSYKKIGLVLSIFFGLIGSVTIVEKIINPLWKNFGLWVPSRVEIYNVLFLFVITIIPVVILIYLIWKLIFSKNI